MNICDEKITKDMTAEEFYTKQGYPILDKFDKKAPKFDYYDFIDFAESHHKAKLKEVMDLNNILDNQSFKSELIEAIKMGESTDYFYNGEDEQPYDVFEADIAFEYVIDVIKKYLKTIINPSL